MTLNEILRSRCSLRMTMYHAKQQGECGGHSEIISCNSILQQILLCAKETHFDFVNSRAATALC